jgi:hypothetical protein
MEEIVHALMRLEVADDVGAVLDVYTGSMAGRALNSLISSLGRRRRPWISMRVFRWAQVGTPFDKIK